MSTTKSFALELVIGSLNDHNDQKRIMNMLHNIMNKKNADNQQQNDSENRYIETTKYPRYQYEQQVQEYIKEYAEAKTVFDKVQIKPPQPPSNVDMDVFTYQI